VAGEPQTVAILGWQVGPLRQGNPSGMAQSAFGGAALARGWRTTGGGCLAGKQDSALRAWKPRWLIPERLEGPALAPGSRKGLRLGTKGPVRAWQATDVGCPLRHCSPLALGSREGLCAQSACQGRMLALEESRRARAE